MGDLRDTRASQKVKVFGSSCILGKRANVADPEAQLGCKETWNLWVLFGGHLFLELFVLGQEQYSFVPSPGSATDFPLHVIKTL